MEIILFDPFSGASGDMIIAALIDLGADAGKIRDSMELAADVNVEISKKVREGIPAHYVNVMEKKEGSLKLDEILQRINSLKLPETVRSNAISIFNILGNAEAKVHGVPLQELHFHEIGQEDAIADIVGVCMAFHYLELDKCRIYCNPISVGEGFVEFSHGKYPVPAPATLEILNGSSLSWQFGPYRAELLTPTGAAILTHFVNGTGKCPPMVTENVGYGSGHTELPGPNLLRVISGRVDEALLSDRIEMLETNVDDVTGQVLGNLIDELIAAGAMDVAILHATMKKGRSGNIIKVITKPEDSDRLAKKIIDETGSLGVRIIPVKHRLIAKRELNSVKISIGDDVYSIAIKIARDLENNLLNISAEFDDCKKVSSLSGVPVRDIIRKAENEAHILFN